MPRAIAGGVCFVIVLYLLVNVSYLAVLGPSGVLQSVAVAMVSTQSRLRDKLIEYSGTVLLTCV